ncbi:MAG: lauroyl acyltransferase [Alphaproteobacteria bacterium]
MARGGWRDPIRRRIVHPVQAVAALVVYGLFAVLPVGVASAVGGWLLRMVGPRLRRLSGVARRNLAAAFPDAGPAEIERIIVAMWDNLGRNLGEFPHLKGLADGDRVTVEGAEYVTQLRDDGRPGIFFSAHFGNWEVAQVASRRHGLPLSVVYRAPNNPLVEWLYARRCDDTLDLIPKGSAGAKRLLKVLRQGGHLTLLVDQKMNDGIPVPFFGRPAMTAPALAEFALRYRCPVVPTRVERLEGARFRIVVEPPLDLPDTGNHHDDVAETMRRVNAVIETWIRARPEQWLWVHRRWPDQVS